MNQSLLYEFAAVMPEVITSQLLPSLITFQVPSTNLGDTGAPDGEYVDVVGLVLIQCTVPPNSPNNIRATEMKATAEVMAKSQHIATLQGYYPAVEDIWRQGARALVGNADQFGQMVNVVTYDILGVDANAFKQTTRVFLQLATV